MIKIKEITDFLDAAKIPYSYYGEEQLIIKNTVTIENINHHLISWIKNKDYMKYIVGKDIKNSLIVCQKFDVSSFKSGNFIFCDKPKEVFFTISNHFFQPETNKEYISPNSVVETTNIGNNVYIGHNCYIGPDVIISDHVTIKNNVSIEGKVIIGKNTAIFSGVVIGSDGYGYFQNAEGKKIKVPHYGGVLIGEDVEIGANTCIDRGTLGDTKIGSNVKIDNLCHISHNVVIEENVSVVAHSMIGGSVLLKKNSYIAPSASVMNQISIGENSLIGLGAVVLKDVEDHVVVAGVPGKIIKRLEVGE